jgi:hypothetical protein
MAFILDTRTIFSATTLTGSYVTQTGPGYFETTNVDQVVLDVIYTPVTSETGNSIQIRVQFANPVSDKSFPASTDWVTPTAENTAHGITTLTLQNYTFAQTGTGPTPENFQIDIPIQGKYMRIAIKESDQSSTNFGTATIKATLRSEQSFN